MTSLALFFFFLLQIATAPLAACVVSHACAIMSVLDETCMSGVEPWFLLASTVVVLDCDGNRTRFWLCRLPMCMSRLGRPVELQGDGALS